MEGFRKGGVVAPAFGDVQVAGVFDGRVALAAGIDHPSLGGDSTLISFVLVTRLNL